MNDQANWYSTVFKGWQVKSLGPKPTPEMLQAVHNLGLRPGKQALANAMGLRDCGVTASQIVMATGAPQLNRMRGLITDALVKRIPTPASAEGHTVYKLELTAKGKQRIERTAKLAADKAAEGEGAVEKPAKAAAKPKGKAKAKKAVEVPADETSISAAAIEADAVELAALDADTRHAE